MHLHLNLTGHVHVGPNGVLIIEISLHAHMYGSHENLYVHVHFNNLLVYETVHVQCLIPNIVQICKIEIGDILNTDKLIPHGFPY